MQGILSALFFGMEPKEVPKLQQSAVSKCNSDSDVPDYSKDEPEYPRV